MAILNKGIDVAHHEPVIKWELLRQQDIHFVFIKATEGVHRVDPKFKGFWTGAKQAGILRSAYHFLHPDIDGRRQAEFFLSTVFPEVPAGERIHPEPGDLPLVLDVEEIYENVAVPTPPKKKGKGRQGQGQLGTHPTHRVKQFAPRQVTTCAEVWLKTVEERTGCKPIIYSRRSYLLPNMRVNGKPPDWAREYLLWLAHYKDDPETDRPDEAEGWQDWSFWQYSENGFLDGVLDGLGRRTAVDLNCFRGTLEELYALAGTTPPPVSFETPMFSGPLAYGIESGDTLNDLAARFDTTEEAILAANPQLTSADSISPGDVIVVP